jgi:hypothetical protein
MPATLSAPSVISTEQLRQYATDGYCIVRGLFEHDEILEAIHEAERLYQLRELIRTENIRCRWQPHIQTNECLFECFDPVIDLSPKLEKMARDPRILGVLSAIYGEPAHLFKDKLIFKPPGAKGYDLHQDYISWPTFPRSFVTAAIALDPSGAANGATEVFPGYHRLGYLSPADGMYHSLSADTVDVRRGVLLELEPGDTAFFGAFTPHRSSANRSDRWRRLLYLSYNADSEGGDQRDKHYREFHLWLKDRYAEYGKHDTYFA